jgi:sugar phosphate isomerase/epimerase
MMKIGFIADNDLPGIESDARFCAEHGISGLEFNYWSALSDLTPEFVAQMRATLDKYRVECSTLGLWGWNHTAVDAAEQARALKELDCLVEYGKVLGAKVLITSGGNRPDQSIAENVAAFAAVFPPYLERLEAAGMKLSIYAVHGNTFTVDEASYEALWAQFPTVGIKCDPANLRHAGLDYLGFLHRHGGHINHMHVKEHLYFGDELVSQPAAGMGDIEWGKVFAFLYEHGYNGYLTIEPHGGPWTRPPLRYKGILLAKKCIEQFLV